MRDKWNNGNIKDSNKQVYIITSDINLGDYADNWIGFKDFSAEMLSTGKLVTSTDVAGNRKALKCKNDYCGIIDTAGDDPRHGYVH